MGGASAPPVVYVPGVEAGPPQPLKVCRKCSVASRTEAATCPACGRSYERRAWQWRWWMAIPIVALAFAVGYFGISKLVDDDDPAGITVAEAGAIEPGISEADLVDRLGEDPAYRRDRGTGTSAASCDYYGVTDEPDSIWEFCFRDDKLVGSTAVGAGAGEASPAVPAAP